MVLDEPGVRGRLARAVSALTDDVLLREELVQEAEFHWWLEESRRPDQTECWYRENCVLFLLNYLRRGHSLDSPKRRHLRSTLTIDSDDGQDGGCALEPQDSFLGALTAQEDARHLLTKLKPTHQVILCLRLEGLEEKEIARALRL